MSKVIVDTNIIFSSLLKEKSILADILWSSDDDEQFFICEYIIVEIFKNKEKIIKFTKLSETQLTETYYTLLKKLSIYKENKISQQNWKKAYQLCQDIDENDTPHIALTLELNGLLWTGDKTLKKGLLIKGFNQFYEPNQEKKIS